VGEVVAYRDAIDERVAALVERCDDRTLAAIAPLIELGLHHEQQHQELLLTDVKLLLAANPIRPRYREAPDHGAARDDATGAAEVGPPGWIGFEAGVVAIGHDGPGFAYDNEGPRHRRFLEPFELADRLVTNGEMLAFVEDGGYRRPELWLDDGWTWVRGADRRHPEYWRPTDDDWRVFTLDGERPLARAAPACHLSFFEADAYARWAGARLPTEVEWEHASEGEEIAGNLLESGRLHPAPAPAGSSAAGGGLRQMFGDAWEWTRSAHEPYPGYRPEPGAIGEYNGKFMCGSFVLRGGSCATSRSHVRRTYRNFFPPDAVWQLTGVRLARSPR
jgi:ergothioneine biosynthesis protein EgtB